MFRGNHPTRVDEKGRLKVPADFKHRVDEVYGTQFFITSKDGQSAEIYPLPEWEKIEAKIAALSSFNPAKRKFLERVNYYGQMVELDSQGRLLLPQILRESARLVGDVDVFGHLTYLEVVNHDAFKQGMDASPWTPEDDANLESHGV
ncbi:MAG TPA: division/cell wall cluster transcriptional repressor MraZ [Acidisarcina sp.]